MPEQSAQDKTEPATTRRREEAKEKGNVLKSMDLNSVAVLMSGILAIKIISDDLIQGLSDFATTTYINLSSLTLTADSFPLQFFWIVKYFASILAPFFILLLLIALGINIAQTGVVFANKALIPDFKKINPATGFKRIFSMRSVVESLKGILKILIVSSIAFYVLKKHTDEYWILHNVSASQTFAFIGEIFLDMSIKIGIALIILAIADFIYQKYEYEKNLKMTKQEVRDELKQYEGSAEVKGRIRSAQRQASRNRMMAAVPDATVVVTNPTFIALALKYDPIEKSDAPKVVAKGKRKLAEKIKQIARENGVPIVEHKPLARSLYDVIEVGMEIPFIFYQVVAEVIAQVYQQNADRKAMKTGYSNS